MFTRPQLKSNELRMAKTVQPLDPSKSSASVHRPESNHEYTIKASQTVSEMSTRAFMDVLETDKGITDWLDS